MLTTFRRQKRKLAELYECLKQRYEGGRPVGTSSPLFLPKNLVASPQGEPPSFGAQSNPKFGSISFPSRVREQELAPRHTEVDRTHLQGIPSRYSCIRVSLVSRYRLFAAPPTESYRTLSFSPPDQSTLVPAALCAQETRNPCSLEATRHRHPESQPLAYGMITLAKALKSSNIAAFVC